MKSPHLVLVSNRIPITFTTEDGVLKGQPASGGLVSALEPLLKDHGGIWVGSGGTEDSPRIRKILEKASGNNPYRYAPLFLTEEEQSNYYEGFSNEIVWPLFHDLQSRCNFDPNYWEFYERVNRKFADAVEKVSEARRPDLDSRLPADAGGQDAALPASGRTARVLSSHPVSLSRYLCQAALADTDSRGPAGARPGWRADRARPAKPDRLPSLLRSFGQDLGKGGEPHGGQRARAHAHRGLPDQHRLSQLCRPIRV